MKTYSRLYAAGFILIGFMMSSAANQPQLVDQIRLVKVGETMLYIPESMIASFVSGEEPKFDRNLPLETVINAHRVVQLALDNRDSRYPDGNPRLPRPWESGFTDVHLVDLSPGFSNLTHAEFERDYVRNGNPLNTHFNCNRSYFGRDGFDYCEVQRLVLPGVRIKYRWAGRVVDPATWPQMDRRVQKIVEWLAIPPDRRPAKITD